MTGPILGIDPGTSGAAFVLRTPAGIALASGSTFAEVWRKRPQIGAQLQEASR